MAAAKTKKKYKYPRKKCPKCKVYMDTILFMGVQPDGYACPKCHTYYTPALKPLGVMY